MIVPAHAWSGQVIFVTDSDILFFTDCNHCP